jgi:uncharacterized SAM-binding protein YcdF (DUF218 family)
MKLRLRRLPPLWAALGLALLLVATSGQAIVAQKVVAHLLLPAGFLWLASWAAIFAPRIGKGGRLGASCFFLIYSFAGSPYAGAWLLGLLERPFYPYEQPEEKLDALVLLGGATALSPGGRPALGTHGDRVTRPVVLYREGLVGTLVTTGRSVTEDGAPRLLSRETAELWQAMGVPAERIVEVPEPRTTREELVAVAALVQRHPEWKRIGLSSSASHLARAMAEARAVGLDPIPVPSDFRSGRPVLSPLYLVPQGRGFRDVQTALWEFLGRAK